MLTYQLQDRVIKLGNGQTANFPAQVRVEVRLGPSVAFGASADPSRVYVHSRAVTINFDGNTGRISFRSDPPLEPLRLHVDAEGEHLRLEGDLLVYEGTCESAADLSGLLQALQFVVPGLLSLSLAEPAFVRSISGTIGEAQFEWIHQAGAVGFRAVSRDDTEERVRGSLAHMQTTSALENRRLLAAVNYLHEALRLRAVGASEWECMSGCILCWCKVLEILFGGTRDAIREQLVILGYSAEVAEADFVLMLLLRSHLDVAHPRLAVAGRDQLSVIYEYLRRAEDSFKDLLDRVITRVKDGSYKLLHPGSLALSADEQRGLDRLVATLAERGAAGAAPAA